jgi:hypothetical protein
MRHAFRCDVSFYNSNVVGLAPVQVVLLYILTELHRAEQLERLLNGPQQIVCTKQQNVRYEVKS